MSLINPNQNHHREALEVADAVAAVALGTLRPLLALCSSSIQL